jgi:hypothetical protein
VALDTPKNLKAPLGPEATLEDAFMKLTGTKIRDEPVVNNHSNRSRFHFGGMRR